MSIDAPIAALLHLACRLSIIAKFEREKKSSRAINITTIAFVTAQHKGDTDATLNL